jgi:hypothetical protein
MITGGAETVHSKRGEEAVEEQAESEQEAEWIHARAVSQLLSGPVEDDATIDLRSLLDVCTSTRGCHVGVDS